METRNISLEIKKIILAELQGPNAPASKVIEDILCNFILLYSSSHQNTDIMKIAYQYIQAYLQLGFSYLEHESLFDEVLEDAGISPSQITALQMQNTKIKLSRTQIRSVMGRWTASSYNSHTITSAVDDIISHVKKKEVGSYQYYTSKKDGSYTALFQLTVTHSYALFHDVFKNKFYHLIEK